MDFIFMSKKTWRVIDLINLDNFVKLKISDICFIFS